MFNILQEVLRSHPILVSRKFKMPGCLWYGVKRTKSTVYTQLRGIVEAFFTPSSSHFFIKNDLEQYLFNGFAAMGCDRCVETRVY